MLVKVDKRTTVFVLFFFPSLLNVHWFESAFPTGANPNAVDSWWTLLLEVFRLALQLHPIVMALLKFLKRRATSVSITLCC